MPDITTAEGLLAEILEQASKLPFEPPSNPNSLCGPIDEIDNWIDKLDPDPAELPAPSLEEKANRRNWLIEHDYYEDGEEDNDPELEEALRNTLDFFVKEDRYSLSDPDFEFEFRAYMHNGDYSYPLKMISRVIQQARESGTLNFLK